MRWMLACAFVLLPAAPAYAEPQRVLLLAPRLELELDRAQRDVIDSALASALQAQGAEPIARPASGEATPVCQELACIQQQLQKHTADHALELAIWRAVGGGIGGVSVALIQPNGVRYSEGANVESTLAAALTSATAGAYAKLRRGPGPWLEVMGLPAGAEIWIDGAMAGTVPQRVRVIGGLHHVVVRKPGFEPHDETITVPRNHDAWKSMTVALPPVVLADRGNRAPASRERASWLNYAVGAAAIGAGVWLGIGPLRSVAEDGECGREEDGRCIGVVRFDGGEGLQLAAAGLLIAAGVTAVVWSPLRVRAGQDYALIEAKAGF